ncbi:4Fe-4S dicluster domain-containing protein [Sutterella megalosphaeroides]|uniref:Formate dehydrogenase subunit beta n=1 Tax=Sutterella megalosphaeroides TaxID=2494234 RepID=A0A2Z6IAZ7_9BURK|nr:4Fe-4S dicluster domain-containing protein [Sutterella megalosphaeroides]BBF22767.1 formate dehydrogenase subunit beta [Sutterella megalosphaeroides]
MPEKNKEVAILFDSSHCTGCKGCQVACKQWNMLPSKMGLNDNEFTGSLQGPGDLGGDTRLVMTFDEKPSGNKLQPIHWAIGRRSCFHCTDAGCVAICSSGALKKNDNGVVSFDTEKCNGCTYCQSACPFDVPRFRDTDGKIDKCTLCLDRLEEGQVPACVKTCQPEALKFGPREEMLEIGRKRVEFLKAKGFDKAELYGEKEMGGLHILHVLKFGHEAYGLPTDPKPNSMVGVMQAMKPVTAVGTAAVVAGLAVSFLAAMGYRRQEVSIEEAKKSWTPEQRAKADREVAELLKKEAASKSTGTNAQ